MFNLALGKKPPSGATRIVNSTSSVIFSSFSVIFYSYLCPVGNAGEQPTPEASFKLEYEDILYLLPLVKTITGGFLFYV